MKPFLVLIATNALFRFFWRMGGIGLLIMGIMDSSFLFLPFGNDLLLIALVSAGDSGMKWIYYVLMSSLGSLIGVFLVDTVMRKAGEEGLEKFLKPDKIKRLKAKMEQKAGWAIFFATLLPPPFPFTAVVLTASALQAERKKILIAVFTGRLLRFTGEAMLALYFGRKLIKYINSDIVEYFVYGFIVIAIVGSFFSIKKWLGSRGGAHRMRPQAATK